MRDEIAIAEDTNKNRLTDVIIELRTRTYQMSSSGSKVRKFTT